MKEDALRFITYLSIWHRGRDSAIPVSMMLKWAPASIVATFKAVKEDWELKDIQVYVNSCAKYLKDNNKMIGNCSKGYFYITDLQEGLTVCDDEDKITDARRARTKRRREAIQREYSTEPELNL